MELLQIECENCEGTGKKKNKQCVVCKGTKTQTIVRINQNRSTIYPIPYIPYVPIIPNPYRYINPTTITCATSSSNTSTTSF